MMTLTVNGQTQTHDEGATIASLIESMGLKGRPIAVEVNRDVVPRRAHETTRLHEGDVVELVTLVGGG